MDAVSVKSEQTSVEGDDAWHGARVLNELRIAALAEVDNAKLIWFHYKVCIVAGVGFFADAYDIFAINIAVIMLGYVYGDTPDQHCRPALRSTLALGLKIATPVGTFFGQLFFGFLADIVGRKRMYGLELIIMLVATFAQATAGEARAINIIAMLIFWRFIVGLGVGGDYPLSATIASEFASVHIRGRMMTAVFAAQGWGNFAACLAATVITVAFKNHLFVPNCDDCGSSVCSIPNTNELNHLDNMWRILLGLGCLPAVIALYSRLTIPETPRFTMDIERSVVQAQHDIRRALNEAEGDNEDPHTMQRVEAPRASRPDFRRYFGEWENLKILIGTSYSWLAIDVAFYTLGLNASIILQGIGFGGSSDVYQALLNICVGNLILSVAGLIPGYWICFLFIDKWGRRPIQLMGFIVLAILFSIMGFAFNSLIKLEPVTDASGTVTARVAASAAGTKFFVFLFCLTNLFQNFGPNTTTFIIPGEVFTTRYRATGHGISAAAGKLGAIIAQIMFNWLVDTVKIRFLDHSFEILALFMLTGVLSTYYLVPETKGVSLEVLSREKQEDFMHQPRRRIHVQNGVVMPAGM
ncbi:inorganic phosphate transporter [Roridomyces roridus]|uniref:Inorganic phosphate transporter n=1 Tax=Roridomyces roridus TaxID=1738132 RepID=A0AAD7FCW6_9AGAR|nr:inorganic phosphate transporter [Roridomyces roridus]